MLPRLEMRRKHSCRRLPATQKRVAGMMVLERSPPGGGDLGNAILNETI